MTITFSCPNCEHEYRGRDDLEGRSVACKKCQFKFEIEGLDDVELIDRQPRKPRRSSKRRKQPDGIKSSTALLIAGGIGIAVVVFIGVVLIVAGNQIEDQFVGTYAENMGQSDQLFDYSAIPLPLFPDVPTGTPVGTKGVTAAEIQFNGGDQPGQKMTVRVYLPPGDHALQSLPCVLVGPAGTTLLTGNSIDGSDYHDEALPYAEAGAVVVAFSLDGFLSEESSDMQFRTAYLKFRQAAAGLVNCRNAMEFAIAKIPAVDPQRIVIAGHSSAAVLALLFAEHEPRLAASVSYCAAADVVERLKPLLAESGVRVLLPGVDDFIVKSAPMTHLTKTNCPIFLFHARDDSNCPYTESVRYQELLEAASIESELKLVDSGDHYMSMIQEGIPSGISWLQTKGIFEKP